MSNGEKMIQNIRERVRENPALAVGIACGCGILVALPAGRKVLLTALISEAKKFYK